MTAPRRTEPKDRLAFDKWDRLGLRVTLWIVAAAATLGLVGMPLLHWVQGGRVTVPLVSPVRVPPLETAGLRHSAASYRIHVDDPSAGQRVLDLAPGVLLAALIVAVVALVLRFVTDVGGGDPFAPNQVRRLRLIAGLLLIGTPVVFAVQLACRGVLLGGLELGGLNPATEISIPWFPLLVGLCVALIAEAFKTGARLRADVDGLI